MHPIPENDSQNQKKITTGKDNQRDNPQLVVGETRNKFEKEFCFLFKFSRIYFHPEEVFISFYEIFKV